MKNVFFKNFTLNFYEISEESYAVCYVFLSILIASVYKKIKAKFETSQAAQSTPY